MPLVRVVAHGVRRESGGAYDELECGHRLTFEGHFPYRRRCAACYTAALPIPLFAHPEDVR